MAARSGLQNSNWLTDIALEVWPQDVKPFEDLLFMLARRRIFTARQTIEAAAKQKRTL